MSLAAIVGTKNGMRKVRGKFNHYSIAMFGTSPHATKANPFACVFPSTIAQSESCLAPYRIGVVRSANVVVSDGQTKSRHDFGDFGPSTYFRSPIFG
jgi:hypothetical protein